ncbi:hypothetical protein ACHAPF_002019 [Botrytis cinerea]
MNGYSKGKEKEKDRYLPARRRGGESGKWIDVVAYGSFSALLALILKYAVSGQYWNLNFFLLALQSGTALAVIWLLKRGGYLTELAGLEFQKLKTFIVENAHAEASYGDRRLEQTLEPQDPVMILFLGYIFMVIHLLLYSTYEAWKAKIVPNLKFGQWDSMTSLLRFPSSSRISPTRT